MFANVNCQTNKKPQDVFKCACGDHAYSIPRDRANEDYNDGAFWCSGTLNMLGYDQNPIIIFNPFSYSHLQVRERPPLRPFPSYTGDCLSPA